MVQCTKFNSIPIILILLTDINAALIYSVTFVNKKQRIACAPTGSLPTCTVALLFLSLMFAYFHNQSPSLTKFEGRKRVVRDKNINGNILLCPIKPKSRTHDSRNRSLLYEIGRAASNIS